MLEAEVTVQCSMCKVGLSDYPIDFCSRHDAVCLLAEWIHLLIQQYRLSVRMFAHRRPQRASHVAHKIDTKAIRVDPLLLYHQRTRLVIFSASNASLFESALFLSIDQHSIARTSTVFIRE